MENNGIRINKFLSEAGACSRREADRMIEEGRISIDGRTAGMGDRVMPGQEVLLDGKKLSKEEEEILIAFNKPEGIVCTAEKREKDNIIDYLHYPKRIYPIGRLDKDSSGLILLTNRGDIVNKMMRSGNQHEKEYIVRVNRPVSDFLVRGLAGGVPLVELGVTTRPCQVEQIGKYELRIILTQGYNRQIRRMCEYFDYRVRFLRRVRVMNIELGDLPEGQYRDVTPMEKKVLMTLLRGSSNETVTEEREKRFRTEKVQKRAEYRMMKEEEERKLQGRADEAGSRSGKVQGRFDKHEDRSARSKKFADSRKPSGDAESADHVRIEKRSEHVAVSGIFTTTGAHDQRAAFEERKRLKEARRQARSADGSAAHAKAQTGPEPARTKKPDNHPGEKS